MGGARKGIDRGLERVQRGLNKRPLAPAAADALLSEGHVGVVGKRRLDAGEMLGLGAGVEMDRHAIARRRQHSGLPNDRVGILVTQKYERDFCHIENRLPNAARTVYSDRPERELNKQAFSAFLNGLVT